MIDSHQEVEVVVFVRTRMYITVYGYSTPLYQTRAPSMHRNSNKSTMNNNQQPIIVINLFIIIQ